MTLKECYAAFGGDYDDVISRLMTEGLVKKFLIKFTQDQSFHLMITSLDSGNYEDAFRAAHTIKGICQNLSLQSLLNSVSPITEELRDCSGNYSKQHLDKLTEDYNNTVSVINQLDS